MSNVSLRLLSTPFLLVFVVIISISAGMIIANGGREFDEVSVKQAQLAQFRDLDGVTRNISHWEGAYRIVNFWATWCPPCREEIPLFVDLQTEFQSINVTFIGIAVDDVERVRTFVAANGVNYPTLIGSGDALRISEILGNNRSGLPYTVFLSPTGEIIDMHSGIVPEAKIRDFVAKVR